MIPLLILPWAGLALFLLLIVRKPRELPSAARAPGLASPLVSVIVPARNEAVNIEACVRSLTGSRYPSFEVIVVDDASEDDTGARARALGRGQAERLVVVNGAPLPHGWLGKPWACAQGAAVARGSLLLFTDADTTHGPDLLSRAIAGMEEDDADLLTLVGTQIMGSFWERLVQPQIFLVMLLRFPRFEHTARSGRWREAIANGQFLLFRREAYERIGGHAAVRDEVVEDMALAQHVKRAGLALRIRSAEGDLATRMYRSLGQLVEGWSKNLVMGGLQSVPAWSRAFVAPLALMAGVGLWLVPPMLLAIAWAGGGGSGLLTWAALTCGISLAIWMRFHRWMDAPMAYAFLYPLGALVGALIFTRSWIRGTHVEWKGRRYDLPPVAGRP
jgi:chlorobactene glucosyltransferase